MARTPAFIFREFAAERNVLSLWSKNQNCRAFQELSIHVRFNKIISKTCLIFWLNRNQATDDQSVHSARFHDNSLFSGQPFRSVSAVSAPILNGQNAFQLFDCWIRLWFNYQLTARPLSLLHNLIFLQIPKFIVLIEKFKLTWHTST